MRPASRTPEGQPNRCPVCGRAVRLEPSCPPGDAPSPSCGSLLWFPRRTTSRRRLRLIPVVVVLLVALMVTVGYMTLPILEWGILATLATVLFARQVVASAGAAWRGLVLHLR
ncbi:MAG TPA: hypothetical protein VGF55_03600 [Gemmataceae bacterium]|jgi:predicted nucleic acid-binding Zn ribbon protein